MDESENYEITKTIKKTDSNLSELCENFLVLVDKSMEAEFNIINKKNYGKYFIIREGDDIVKNGYMCVICLENFKAGLYKRILECGHTYHKKCVDKWFMVLDNEKRATRCPICKKIKKSI